MKAKTRQNLLPAQTSVSATVQIQEGCVAEVHTHTRLRHLRIAAFIIPFVVMMICLNTGARAQNPDSTIENDGSSYATPVANTIPTFQLDTATLSTAASTYLNSKLTAYNAYAFSFSGLNSYLVSNYYAIEFNLGSTFLSLQRRDIRAPNYTQTETQENGTSITRYTQDLDKDSLYEVHTLKGFADHSNTEIARFSIESNGLTGYIWNTETNHVLYYTTLQDFIKSNGDDSITNEDALLVFDLGAIIGNPNAKCGALANAQNSTERTTGNFIDCTPRFLAIAYPPHEVHIPHPDSRYDIWPKMYNDQTRSNVFASGSV